MKKKIISITLVALLMISTLTPLAFAADATPKTETAYVSLAADGSVAAIYVVNAFDGGGEIVDYGDYSEILNLTDTSEVKSAGGRITANVSGDAFYYQGTLAKTALPWDITIEYFLDGKAVTAAELAGAAGAFELRIHVAQGDTRHAVFYERYMMQISLSLDKNLCSNIQSAGAGINVVGKTASISYTHAVNSAATYSLTANVRDFEMSAIVFRAASMGNFGLDIDLEGGVLSEFDELTEGVATMSENAEKLADGSDSFNGGLQSVKSKTGDFAANIAALHDNAGKLNDAAVAFGAGIAAAGGELGLLPQSLAALTGAVMQIPAPPDALTAYAQSMLTGDDPQQTALAAAFLAQNATISEVKNGISALDSFDLAGIAQLQGSYAQLQGGIDGIYSALGAINTAVSGELVPAISTMSTSYSALNEGTAKLADAIVKLNENVAEVPDMLREKIDEYIGSYLPAEGHPGSFVSEANAATSVLFVMQTQEITMPEAAAENVPTARQPVTFWEKLLNLFGLFKAG